MIPTSARRRIVIKMLIDYSTGWVTPRRRNEKKTTSQSSAEAPSYTMGAVGLSTGPLPINYWRQSRRGNKQTNKQAEAAYAEAQMQGAVQSCVACRVQCTMCQSTWRSFGDALEKHRV